MANVEYVETEKYFAKLGIKGSYYPCTKSCCQCVKCENVKELTSCEKERLEQLLELAIEQRKFSIEHYWSRANYFWLFVGAFFVAYVSTLPKSDGCCANNSSSQMEFVNLMVCIGGLFSSICWYFANRGSKYWQENWELHINTLSKKLGKPIFQILMNPTKKWHNLLSYYPYSFTRVNLFLNLVIIGIWTALLMQRIMCIFSILQYFLYILYGSIMIMTILLLLLHFRTKNFVKKAIEGKNEIPNNAPFVYIPN